MNYQIVNVEEAAIAKKYGTSYLVSKLLALSNLSDAKMEELLHPDLHVHKSSAPCLLDACARILKAKENKEKVLIGGDYDADGICATTIMKDTLDRLKIENGYYIPNRFKEGYGLQVHTVEDAHKKGYTLLITVDNGVKAFAALEKAKELGMDVIVTDHHQIEEEVPCDILVHPNYLEEEFAFLSGAGVALLISLELIGEVKEHIALAAIALIADVMPLYRQTRTIVQVGLDYLKQGILPPIQALIKRNSLIDERTISFQVVPKLNSIGRMEDDSNVNTLIPYLLLQDKNEIQAYATKLEEINERRKSLSATMSAQARQLLDEEEIQVLYDSSFHEGICGLVAGKIADEVHKPTLVLTKKEDTLRGSGRSVAGFNLFDFFKDFPSFTAFGGHEGAIGLSLKEEDLSKLHNYIKEKLKEMPVIQEEVVVPAILVDADRLQFDNLNDLEILKPYPKDLIRPLFAIENPEIIRVREYPKVTKYTIAQKDGEMEGVLFVSRKLEDVEQPKYFIGELGLNRWKDEITIQMEIEYLE
ncbi:MAG: DHH family phosphoesterase [Solobacterium sp.]|nr:DHH family phosphoesterase [Solobacterium sp.]